VRNMPGKRVVAVNVDADDWERLKKLGVNKSEIIRRAISSIAGSAGNPVSEEIAEYDRARFERDQLSKDLIAKNAVLETARKVLFDALDEHFSHIIEEPVLRDGASEFEKTLAYAKSYAEGYYQQSTAFDVDKLARMICRLLAEEGRSLSVGVLEWICTRVKEQVERAD